MNPFIWYSGKRKLETLNISVVAMGLDLGKMLTRWSTGGYWGTETFLCNSIIYSIISVTDTQHYNLSNSIEDYSKKSEHYSSEH